MAKSETIQRLAWPLYKDDMQIGEVFHFVQFLEVGPFAV